MAWFWFFGTIHGITIGSSNVHALCKEFALKNDYSTSTRAVDWFLGSGRRKANRQTFPRLFMRWRGATPPPPPLPFFLSNFQTVTKRKVIDGRTSWVAWQNFARKAASAWQKKERKEREKRKIEEEIRERSSCRPRIINSICHFLGAINDSSRHCWFPPF